MPTMVDVTIFKLRPGAWRSFHHAVKRLHAGIEEKNLPMTYAFDWTVSGGDGDEMILAAPRRSWAEFKPMAEPFWGAMEEVYGEYESDLLRKMLDKSVESSESFILVARPGLSVMPKM